MAVSFLFDEEKAAAAVAYLASRRIPDLTKGKICKLIFLADKHHLVRFGRTVTGDRVCALKDGPIPSGVLDMLNSLISDQIGSPHSLLATNISIDRRFSNPHFQTENFCLGEFLSDSDIEAIDAVVQAYGARTFSELRQVTHDMPAYKNAWGDRAYGSETMAFEDFFEEDDEAISGALEEMIENSKLREYFAARAI